MVRGSLAADMLISPCSPSASRATNLRYHDTQPQLIFKRSVRRVGVVRGDEGAGAVLRLDHQRAEAEAGDDPVTGREVEGVRLGAQRVVGHDRALLRDPGVQAPVLGWIDDIDTAAQDGDR